MKSVFKKFKKAKLNQSGQGMLEYILILVIVLAIAGAFRTQIRTWVDGLMGKASGDISGFTNGQ